jgi:predicted cupin superfamily sugar epimerase
VLSDRAIVDALGLVPLAEEGGMFRQSFEADEKVAASALPSRYGRDKSLSTAIYYLLSAEADSFSALHRLPTDEVYHFYLGDPVEMLELHADGTSRRVILGSDLLAGQRVQHVVPRGVWQGSRVLPGGRLALLGTTMAPGFDPLDYEGGVRAELVARYPERADLIRRLTRER